MPTKPDPRRDGTPLHHGNAQPATNGTAPSPAETLTPRQQQILTFMRETVRLKGYPPTIREVRDAAGLKSTSSAAFQLGRLEKKGFIGIDRGVPRGYRILSRGCSQAPVTPSQRPGGCPLLARGNGDEGTDLVILRVVLDPATRQGMLSGALLTVRQLPPSETSSTNCAAVVSGQVVDVAQLTSSPSPLDPEA